MSDPLVRESESLSSRLAQRQLDRLHAAGYEVVPVAVLAQRDRYRKALERIAGAGHSNQERACKICVQIAEMALEGPADA